MKNQQGAPEARSYEHQRAIMEGERNASLDAYSRVVYLTQTESRIYEAGFTNGWNRLAALVEAQQPAPSAAATLPEGWVPLVITHEGQYPEEVAYGPQVLMDRLGKWLRKYFEHVVASKAQPSPTPQADSAPSAAVPFGEAPLPLLVRDIAADLGTTPIQVCTALAQLGFGGHSVNMAVTPRMAKSLRAYFASPTPQADSQPAPQQKAPADELEEVLRERDDAEDFINELLDEVLGADRPEWSSAYNRYDAMNDVRERITALHKPAVDKAWGRFESAMAAPQPAPTPLADSQPAPDQRQQLDAYYSLLDAMGWESKRQHISPETWAADLLRDATAYRAARAPADSVTAPAGGAMDGWKLVPKEPTLHMGWAYLDAAKESDPLRTHTFNHAGYRAMLAAAPTPPAQAADSVLEDAALSSEQQRAIFEAYESAASESYFEVRPQIDCSDRRRVFKAGYERGWDAARKQGGA